MDLVYEFRGGPVNTRIRACQSPAARASGDGTQVWLRGPTGGDGQNGYVYFSRYRYAFKMRS